jgi:hypothetical protein
MPRFLSFAVPLFLLLSFTLMLRRIEPFYTNFYSIAWWCYILWLAARNELHDGPSRFSYPSLFQHPLQYFGLTLLSAATWFFFELYNARLHNWAYVGVPAQRWIRWPGYFAAFGTVLPGIFETARWLESWLKERAIVTDSFDRTPRQAQWARKWKLPAAVMGILCMALPLVYPPWFFPCIWAGMIFVLDPFAESIGETNLVANLFFGDYRRPWLLLSAGLICGLFWELFNFWAGAKWIYTLPYLQFWKMFEMPVLGFLGFPPFALECWLIYVLARHAWEESGVPGRVGIAVTITTIYWAGIFVVDHYVVKGYRV